MKLIQRDKSEVEILGKSSKDVEAKLSVESQDFLIYQLSKIYSDPIGSITRELTSNAYDAQVEAGVTNKAVKVGFGEDSSGAEYVYFKDFGIGMSPEFMEERYMNYGDSTKRDSDGDEDNPLHGMFGFGSKSPFSYVDEYFITTVVEGVKYEYCMFKNQKGKPILNLISTIDSDEYNGTEIRIYLKDDTGYVSEQEKWAEAFQKQLVYFDNVYFDCGWRVSNYYKLYRYNHFVVSTSPYDEGMSIVYGKARYPINWKKLNKDKPKVEPKIGIIIPVGELEVVPSREDIVYNDYEIDVINKAITNAFNEIEELYFEQVTTHKDIVKYYNVMREKDDKDKAGSLIIKADKEFEDDYILDVTSIIRTRKHFFELYSKFGIKRSNEPSLVNIYSLLFEIDYVITNGKKNGRAKNIDISPLLKSSPQSCYRKQGVPNDPKRNKTINTGYVFKLKVQKKKTIVRNISDLFNLPKGRRLRFSRELYKYILNEVSSKTRSYKDTEQTIEKIERDNSIIVFYDCNFDTKKDQKTNVLISELQEKVSKVEKTVVYGTNDQLAILNFLDNETNKHVRNDYNLSHSKKIYRYWYITTASRNIKHVENLKNTMSLEEFMKHRKFREIVSNYLCHKYLINLNDEKCEIKNGDISENLKIINNEVYEVYKECLGYASKVSSYSYKELRNIYGDNKELYESMLEVANEYNLFDENILSKLRIIKRYFKGIELITKIKINENNLDYIISYLKTMCKRVNKDYYNGVTVNWESELRDELNEKVKYLESLETIKNLDYAA